MNRWRYIALLLLLSAALPVQARPQLTAAIAPDQVEDRVGIILRDYKNPALNVGIVVKGGLVFSRGYGAEGEVSPATVYQVGSITKALVGTLAAILWQEGSIDLDTPITAYDERARPGAAPQDTEITLRHLLTHSAGLPALAPNRANIKPPSTLPPGIDPTISKPYSTEELYKALLTTELVFAPGTRHSYCNFCFNLAGHILARAGGFANLASAMQAKLFHPLGMKDSGIGLTPAQLEKLAIPYMYVPAPEIHGERYEGRFNYRIPHWEIGEVAGALGAASNVPDLAKIIRALSPPQYDTVNPLLTDRAIALLFEADHEYLRKGPTPFEQLLGWRRNRFGEYGYIYRHTGHNDGHHGFIAFSTEHGVGVVVLGSGAYDGVELLGNRLLLYVLSQVADNNRVKLLPAG
jgi:CubicO group peptidase (beta-lactamase class C family)